MSLYGKNVKICGIPCGLVLRAPENGVYTVLIEREFATLEQVEGIDWAHPVIEGECPLPVGYGFKPVNTQYRSSIRSFEVTLRVLDQYLGDVTGYVAEVKQLKEQAQEQSAELAAKTAALNDATDLIQGMVDAVVDDVMSQVTE